MDTINTTAVSTENNVVEEKKTANAVKSCGMTQVAGILFWGTVVFQLMSVSNNMVDWSFAKHVIYHILPLTGALAYFGLKKDLTALAERNGEK